jgi:predicted nuclease with TOPRIM domain
MNMTTPSRTSSAAETVDPEDETAFKRWICSTVIPNALDNLRPSDYEFMRNAMEDQQRIADDPVAQEERERHLDEMMRLGTVFFKKNNELQRKREEAAQLTKEIKSLTQRMETLKRNYDHSRQRRRSAR